MIRSRTIRRALHGVLLGVQALGVWVPLADARLESPSASVQVEDQRSGEGSRAHVHGECALCMHLAQREILSSPPADPGVPSVTIDSRPAVPSDALPAPVAASRGARAPPLA